MGVGDGSRSFRGSSQGFLQGKGKRLFRGMFSGPIAANVPCASPPQLTVYLGKRDFVDHIDLVDPVGESLEAREEGDWGGRAGQTPPRCSFQSIGLLRMAAGVAQRLGKGGQQREGSSSTSISGTWNRSQSTCVVSGSVLGPGGPREPWGLVQS